MSPAVQVRALYATQVASRTGSIASLVAVPFLVLAQGGTAAQVGLAAAAASVPVVLGGPLGGGFVERLGAGRMSALADFTSAAGLLAVAALSAAGALPFPLLLVLLFLGALLDSPGEAARRVLLPRLASGTGIPLERAVGNLEGCTRLATLLGGPLGGALAGLIGPQTTIAVTGGVFAVAGVVSALFLRSAAPRAETGSGYWQDVAEGFRFCVQDRLLRLLVPMLVVLNLLDAARISTLLPLYADRALGGAAAFGVVLGVFGAAAFIGSIAAGRVAHRLPRRLTYSIAFLLAGGPSLLAPALGADLPWMIAAHAASGLAAGTINPVLGAVQLERVPEALRGRVFGLLGATSAAGTPLGSVLGGLAATGIGLQPSFGVIAAVYTVVTLVPLLGGSWRLMDRAARPPESSARPRRERSPSGRSRPGPGASP